MNDTDIVRTTRALATDARAAARVVGRANRADKDRALAAIAAEIRASKTGLLAANLADVTRFRSKEGLTPATAGKISGAYIAFALPR